MSADVREAADASDSAAQVPADTPIIEVTGVGKWFGPAQVRAGPDRSRLGSASPPHSGNETERQHG